MMASASSCGTRAGMWQKIRSSVSDTAHMTRTGTATWSGGRTATAGEKRCCASDLGIRRQRVRGYMLGEPRQANRMFRVGRLFSGGLDVALFIAPFHWKRSAGPLSQRGIYLQPDDVAMTCECVGQNMHDLYGAFRILLDMGAPEIGLIGASLGGYNTALFISLTDIASFGAMMVPAVNFSLPLGPDTARLPFAVDGRFREKIRRVWELHSPLNFRPRLPVEKILVVASRGDLVCPFGYVRELCERWGVRNRHFLTGGHWLIFDREERGRAWYAFLRERGFLEPAAE